MSVRPKTPYCDDDIERALAIVARVIELYGDVYWPILERLEQELGDRKCKSSRLARYLARINRNEVKPHAVRPERATGGWLLIHHFLPD